MVLIVLVDNVVSELHNRVIVLVNSGTLELVLSGCIILELLKNATLDVTILNSDAVCSATDSSLLASETTFWESLDLTLGAHPNTITETDLRTLRKIAVIRSARLVLRQLPHLGLTSPEILVGDIPSDILLGLPSIDSYFN